MTQVAPRQAVSAELQQALAALKRAANERRFHRQGTSEYASALELEGRLARVVHELAAAVDHDAPERRRPA